MLTVWNHWWAEDKSEEFFFFKEEQRTKLSLNTPTKIFTTRVLCTPVSERYTPLFKNCSTLFCVHMPYLVNLSANLLAWGLCERGGRWVTGLPVRNHDCCFNYWKYCRSVKHMEGSCMHTWSCTSTRTLSRFKSTEAIFPHAGRWGRRILQLPVDDYWTNHVPPLISLSNSH